MACNLMEALVNEGSYNDSVCQGPCSKEKKQAFYARKKASAFVNDVATPYEKEENVDEEGRRNQQLMFYLH